MTRESTSGSSLPRGAGDGDPHDAGLDRPGPTEGGGRGGWTRWALAVLAAVGVLVLALLIPGLIGGSPDTSPVVPVATPTTASGTTAEETVTTTGSGTTAEETVTTTATGTTAEGTITCEHPDGYAVTYPADWQTYPNEEDPDLGHLACSIFGTAQMELEPATSMPRVPIIVKVDSDVSFEDATRPEARSGESPSRDLETQHTTVAGRPAVRVVSVSEAPEDAPPSDYYLPRGTEWVSWIVDLSTDTTDRVLLGSAIPLATASTGVTEADKVAEGATSVDATADVLDAMMASLTLTD